MRRLKKLAYLAVGSAIVLAGSVAIPANAESVIPAPGYDPSLESPLPDRLSIEEMKAIDEGQGMTLTPSSGPSKLKGSSISSTNATAAVAKCTFDPGQMWSRKSGNIYKYGTVGGKPQMRDCTSGVMSTQISSDVFRFNGWWWERVAGTFTSYGTGNMTQKSVEYVCKGTNSNKYKVIGVGTVVFTNGTVGTTKRSTPEASFNCT